jgi:hypothetical protein
MIEEARQRSQEILDEAERLAAESQARLAEASSVVDAADPAGDGAPSEDAKRELEEQVTYLRTFSEVCRVQLRAYLEALLRDIEDEWGRAHPQVVESLARRQEPAAVLSLHAAGANDQPDGAGLADGERAAAEPRYGKPQVAYQDAYQDDEDGPADDDADRSEYGVEYDQYGVQYNAQFDAETDADDDDPDDEQPAPRHLSVTIPDCRMPTVSQLR